jgi:uncharacterized protein
VHPRKEVYAVRVLIGGSHGFVGEPLANYLMATGHEVVRLIRSSNDDVGEIEWHPESGQFDPSLLEGIDAVIHLGGVGIGERRWTQHVRQQLWDSRVLSTETLANAMASVTFKPKTFICASAVGYYGDRSDEVLTESSGQGEGFLAALCAMWEDATTPARDAGIRVVNLRSGVVIDPIGGTLAKQLPLFRSFAGGPLSLGSQWMSWITLYDEISAIVWALENDTLVGGVNLVTPNPVINRDYTFAIAEAISRPNLVPTPKFLLELVLGKGLTQEVLLASQRAYPEKLLESGFQFRFPEIKDTLRLMLTPETRDDSGLAEESDLEFWENTPRTFLPSPPPLENGNGHVGPSDPGTPPAEPRS